MRLVVNRAPPAGLLTEHGKLAVPPKAPEHTGSHMGPCSMH